MALIFNQQSTIKNAFPRHPPFRAGLELCRHRRQHRRGPHRGRARCRRDLEQGGSTRPRHCRPAGSRRSRYSSKGKPREEHDREVVAALKQHNVDLVCLAGYMRLLSPWFVKQFPRRILNIHPSLLPAFPGLEAQEQAFAYGVKVSGCTVHFVDEELDHGAIIVQKTVPVLDSDDEHTLAARILEQEHIAYTEAINIVLGETFEIAGRRLKSSQKAEVRMQK
jgi:phosphoribosylglycinamide formyltransferase 1